MNDPERLAFPPETLRQYALVADGERGALVGPRGDIAFLCFPRWHDEALFASLVGGPGHFAVTPRDGRFVWGGHYEPGTLVWRSRWVTSDGVVECREALARPAYRDRLVLLRRVEALEGDAHVRVVLDPRPGFGRRLPLRRLAPGTWGTTGDEAPALRFRAGCDAMTVADDRLVGDLDVPEGRRHDLVLEVCSASAGPGPPVSAEQAWAETEKAWRDDQPRLASSLAPEEVQHSYAVMRGLTSQDGGMAAAATMSLPEHARSGRNYDYRYAWIRDQCYAGQAAAVAGADGLLDAAVGFVAERLLGDGPRLKPAYTVDGGPVPDERPLDLPGYPGGEVRTATG